MTGADRGELSIALEFLRDWRQDDKEWKDKTDTRLGHLESRNVAADSAAAAVLAAKVVVDKATETAVELKEARTNRIDDDRRWRIGLIAGVGGSLVLGVLNLIVSHHP